MFYENEQKRVKERQRRRKIIQEWKDEAKVIRDADPNKKILLREAKRESLLMIEDAARTVSDFEKVIVLWDNVEIVESWRLENHEEFTLSNFKDYELPDSDTIIPAPFNHVWWKQLLNGNFLDIIHDCPHEIHELTSSRPVYDFTKELDENHKEVLYYRVIRQWTPQKIAAFRSQSDRNIRKVYNNTIAGIRRKMYIRLYKRYVEKLPLTKEQRDFMGNYFEQLNEKQQKKIMKKLEKEPQAEDKP